MKKLFLFDMDGTLTPSRKTIEKSMIIALQDLMKISNVGIVTGSGYEYVKEQCHDLLLGTKINKKNLSILPCNGTQRYIYGSRGWNQVYSVSMKNQIGEEKYRKIITEILKIQSKLVKKHKELPVSGTFMQYRKSLLNWCPMGRDHQLKDRENFIKLDEKESLRKKSIQKLVKKINLKNDNLSFALGGECSVDIYPKGWDKTYALTHFEHYETIYFVGDRCKKGGNDYHLYKKLKEKNRAFKTKNPENTIEIINNLILPNIL